MADELKPVEEQQNEKPAIPQETPAEKPAEEKPAEGGEKPVEQKPEEKPESNLVNMFRKRDRENQRRIADLERKIAEITPKEEGPKRENFDNDEDFINAVVDHRVKTAVVHKPNVATLYDEKISEARKAHEDFDEASREIDHIAKSMKRETAIAFVEAVEALPYGSELLYHIAKNPETFEEIAILPPAALAVRLGEIHSDIRRSKTAPKKPSAAPAPITPVTPAATPEKDYDSMSMEEFEKTRRKERLAHKMKVLT